MAKQIESVIVSYEDYVDLEFVPPSKWYIRNATGDYEFVKVQKREKAQQFFDEKYGVGKFSVRGV